MQFKSPYSLSSNFIFSISNITISFWKLILTVAEPDRYVDTLVWYSETKMGQVKLPKDYFPERYLTVADKNEISVNVE